MSTTGNILWLIFGGLITAFGYYLGGLLLCLTIIGIPFGVQTFQLGTAVLMPFGKRVTPKDRGSGCVAIVFNVLWLVLFGWELALLHLFFALVLAVTVIGIPFAVQHFKLAQVALLPFSYRLD